MDDISAGGLDRFDLFAQPGEVGGKNGRSYLYFFRHGIP
jgi:hypothetical protein